MFLTMFGEKLNGADPEDVIRNTFASYFDEEATGTIQEDCLREQLATRGNRFTEEEVQGLYRVAPIDKKGVSITSLSCASVSMEQKTKTTEKNFRFQSHGEDLNSELAMARSEHRPSCSLTGYFQVVWGAKLPPTSPVTNSGNKAAALSSCTTKSLGANNQEDRQTNKKTMKSRSNYSTYVTKQAITSTDVNELLIKSTCTVMFTVKNALYEINLALVNVSVVTKTSSKIAI
ncbi:hypothetical protein Celaphus_00018729 [Cervus elaphus hippelaphus]|uniref:EF-hand domain-containing protein n=1 Tax=Cervus elaphus hippelaphus TaxID=46360 RepID=A0A212C613_CEREH|nr:hypothetical protein Celaphus_00018729 [Cervus elaphus hippelaphus]